MKMMPVLNDTLFEELTEFRQGKKPKGYNETIKWLMVNDQMPEQVICSDKYLCRSYVANRVGTGYLREVFQVSKSIDKFVLNKLPKKFALKTNHDSGSVFLVEELANWRRIKRRIRRKMKMTYGLDKGEWAYSHILPLVFAEELMDGPVIDYKFHCCDGEICWVQIIWNRKESAPNEANVDEEYCSLNLHLDQNFTHSNIPPIPPTSWPKMREIAKGLSRGFKYVRVDLYEYRETPSFGEMTFWPLAGKYATDDEPEFGKLLKVNTASTRTLIYDFFSTSRCIDQ